MNQHSMKSYIYVSALFVVIISLVLTGFSLASNIIGPNNRNVTVRTYVNITNAKPEVLGVAVYQDVNYTLANITLSAGSLRNVVCNASLRDWNGYTDIVQVNSTLWNNGSTQINASDDNNTHYTNTNCTNTGNGLNFTVNYLCNFSVYYYANNGTWTCSVTDMDTYNKTGTGIGNTTVLPIFALNVTDGINFGNVGVEDISVNTTANITNFGNMAINVSVQGYGSVPGDGLAMNCSLGGNITVENERFSTISVPWAQMINLSSSSAQLLINVTMPKQNVSNVLVSNTTYWQLYVDSKNNPGGNCSGYVVFMAQAP